MKWEREKKNIRYDRWFIWSIKKGSLIGIQWVHTATRKTNSIWSAQEEQRLGLALSCLEQWWDKKEKKTSVRQDWNFDREKATNDEWCRKDKKNIGAKKKHNSSSQREEEKKLRIDLNRHNVHCQVWQLSCTNKTMAVDILLMVPCSTVLLTYLYLYKSHLENDTSMCFSITTIENHFWFFFLFLIVTEKSILVFF